MAEETEKISINGIIAELERLISSKYLDSKDFELLLKKAGVLEIWNTKSDEFQRKSGVCFVGFGNVYAREVFEWLFTSIINNDKNACLEFTVIVLKDYIQWNSKHLNSKLDFKLLFEELAEIYGENELRDIKKDIANTRKLYSPKKHLKIWGRFKSFITYLLSDVPFGKTEIPRIFVFVAYFIGIFILCIIAYNLCIDFTGSNDFLKPVFDFIF
ncbi:hypothetical protein HNP93_001363 [Methanococcus maripaludis]|uniref:Uncharacterized protein n=1 Tax=Methanococcus maripaludis TaxID=39152 RepID=A0A7J9P658_METMI|nr:hypothetical protein [Methanococcus maripaludis]MBA2858662.1 hypothetical protein [Methanococcus maripaludis]